MLLTARFMNRKLKLWRGKPLGLFPHLPNVPHLQTESIRDPLRGDSKQQVQLSPQKALNRTSVLP